MARGNKNKTTQPKAATSHSVESGDASSRTDGLDSQRRDDPPVILDPMLLLVQQLTEQSRRQEVERQRERQEQVETLQRQEVERQKLIQPIHMILVHSKFLLMELQLLKL